MFVIAMAEDNATHEATAAAYLERYFDDRGEQFELVRCHTGTEVVGCATRQVDAFLLDIEMPQMDGLNAAKAIREKCPGVPICFLTSYGRLAPAGYEVDAVGFLVKPLQYRIFSSTMDRVLARARSRRPALVEVKRGKESLWINAREIAYVESVGKKTVIHMADGSEMPCTESLRSLETRLSKEETFRVHNAFLVNLGFVWSVSPTDVVVTGRTIPLSKHRKQAFMQSLTTYLGANA